MEGAGESHDARWQAIRDAEDSPAVRIELLTAFVRDFAKSAVAWY